MNREPLNGYDLFVCEAAGKPMGQAQNSQQCQDPLIKSPLTTKSTFDNWVSDETHSSLDGIPHDLIRLLCGVVMATAETRKNRLIILLVSPASLWLIAFFVLPVSILFIYSFWKYVPGEAMQPALVLENYLKCFDWYHLKVLFRSLYVSIGTTILTLVLGWPIAVVLAHAKPRTRGVLYVLVLAPLLTSAVVRTFGWMILLGRKGFINNCLIALGLIEDPIKFMYTDFATVIALTEVLMPFMIFSLESVLHNIDASLYEAAKNLGAHAVRIFFTITVPLCVPGIAAGSILVFSLAISAYVTPALMGGPSHPVMPTLIYDQALNLFNWPLGAAISFVLLSIMLWILYLYIRVLRLGKLADILR